MNKTKFFRHDHKSLQHWYAYGYDTYLNFLISQLHPKKDELILDNGCGNGRFSVAIGQKEAKVVAIDINITLLKKAGIRAREEMISHRIEFVLADMQNLPFRINIFDKILCVNNLWYVPHFKTAVREMFRTLKKNGAMLIDHLNLLNRYVFLSWVRYTVTKILRRGPTPIFYRIPYEILDPFAPFQKYVFSLVIKQKNRLYLLKGTTPFGLRLIIKSSKKTAIKRGVSN